MISDKIVWIYCNVFGTFIAITNLLRLTHFTEDEYYHHLNKCYSMRDRERHYDRWGEWLWNLS